MSLPGRRGAGEFPDARSRSRAMCPTHERTTRWQVSWLADHRFLAAFPEMSPVACGPQAPGLQLRVQPRNYTEFPRGRPTGQHHLRALSENGQARVNSHAISPFKRGNLASDWQRSINGTIAVLKFRRNDQIWTFARHPLKTHHWRERVIFSRRSGEGSEDCRILPTFIDHLVLTAMRRRTADNQTTPQIG